MAAQLTVLGTLGGWPAEHRLLGRTRHYLSHGLLFLFLRHMVPRLGKGGKEGPCVFVGILRDLNEDIQSLLLSLCNF